MLSEGLPVSDKKLKLLKKETCNDQTLKILREFTLNGWPTNKCMIKTFMGGKGWGSSEGCLKWGNGRWGSLRDLSKNILKQGWVKANCS